MINSMHHKMRKNTVHGSAKNIRDHYDLGNEMFQLFLDPSMTYSCGIFKGQMHSNPQKSMSTIFLPLNLDPSTALRQSLSLSMDELYEAQMRKFDDTFETLQLSGEHKVLEIGSGWGACATRAAKKFGCQWTCITNSREQYL
jgi:cyclopropane-fatty-acyl-phospholipid synthase